MSAPYRVPTELLHLFVVPAASPHPVQLNRQFPRHRYLGDLAPAPHGSVKEPAAPLRIAAHCHLRRLTSRKRNSALPDPSRYFAKSGESRFKMRDAGETRSPMSPGRRTAQKHPIVGKHKFLFPSQSVQFFRGPAGTEILSNSSDRLPSAVLSSYGPAAHP
jgi:hypothetical protein